MLIYLGGTHHLQVRYQEAEPMKTVGLWLAQAYNEWEDDEAGKDLAKNVLPVNLTRMTEEQSDNSLSCDWVKDVKSIALHIQCMGPVCSQTLTWIRRVLGMHRKLTVTDSFFRNSDAISPRPAPWSQSKTRSRFVRIWTARDQENRESVKDGTNESFSTSYLHLCWSSSHKPIAIISWSS